MKRINLSGPEFVYDSDDPPGYRSGMARLGPPLGAKQSGTSVYELPPGESMGPYHYECAEEEWLVVLSGRPTLRDPDGLHQLEPWDLMMFPTGPAGAHTIQNDSDAPARVLMFSPVVYPAATVYPDSDKIAVWTGNRDDDVIVRRSSRVDYYDGEG